MHTIAVEEGLHLKSMMSLASCITLVALDTTACRSALRAMKEHADISTLFVPGTEPGSANVVRANQTLITQGDKQAPRSQTIFSEWAAGSNEVPPTIHGLENTEIAKVDGAFTCCSILVP